MRTPVLALIAVFGLGLLSAPASLQQKGGEDISGPYDVVPNWPQPINREPGYIQGSQANVFAETPNRVYLVSRGELKLPDKLPPGYNGSWGSLNMGVANAQKPTPPTGAMRHAITIVDANGKLLEAWTQWDHLFEKGSGTPTAPGRQFGPHSAAISPYDPERHVWIIDDKSQQIFKFTNDGKKLELTIGQAQVKGNDTTHMGGPTDIAWLPDGTFFVSDGYDNSRVVKFDKNGKVLTTWGTPGKGPSQFSTPHSIAIDKNRRVYVADRGNSRIQIFDENGKFLDMWPNIESPYNIRVSGDQYLWVADAETMKFLKYDLNGKLLYSWGTNGTWPGAFLGIHGFSVDSDGNLYTADNAAGRTQKFRPKPGAIPSTLIGKPLPLMGKAST